MDALEYSNLDGLALAEKVKAGEVTTTELSTLALGGIVTLGRTTSSEDVYESITSLFNVNGHLAVSLPLARSQEGLPVGAQVITNFADEATLFQIAAACEQEYQWHLRKPPVHFSDYSYGIS